MIISSSMTSGSIPTTKATALAHDCASVYSRHRILGDDDPYRRAAGALRWLKAPPGTAILENARLPSPASPDTPPTTRSTTRGERTPENPTPPSPGFAGYSPDYAGERASSAATRCWTSRLAPR